MSWFDSAGLSSLAKTAFSSAQKSIDRVLDIQEDELGGSASSANVNRTADSVETNKAIAGNRGSQSLSQEKKTPSRLSTPSLEESSPKTPTSATKPFQEDNDSFWNSFLDDSPTTTTEKTNPPKKTRPSSRRLHTKQKGLGSTSKLPGSLQRDLKDDIDDDADGQSPDVSEKSRQRKPLRLKTGGKTLTRDVPIKTKEDESITSEKDTEKSDNSGSLDVKKDEEMDVAVEISGVEEQVCELNAADKEINENKPDEVDKIDDANVKETAHNDAPEESPRIPDTSENEPQEQEKEDSSSTEKKEGGTDEMNSSGMTISQEPEMLEIPDEKEEEESEANKQPVSPTDSKSDKSDNSLETNVEDHDRTSSRSDSDFVVINETGTGSEQSSLYMYDTRASPDAQSPKHYSSSSNGKRSPDSDFSIISEGRFHDMQDSIHSDIRVNTDCAQDSPLSPPQRASPSYSADVESEDQDDKSTAPSSREEDIREEGTSTPTPPDSMSPVEEPCEGEEEEEDVNRSLIEDVTPRPLEHTSAEGSMKINLNDSKSQTVNDASSSNLDTTPTGDTDKAPPSNPLQSEKLLKKLAEMAEVLQAREAQIMSLSKQIMDFTETTNILKTQLQQSESSRESEMQDLTALTEEFTQRISSMEKKLSAAMKERDLAKKDVQQLKKDLSNKEMNDQTQLLLQDKDEQITGLLAEGEKLSKQQLQNSNIIKKLRTKEKENETVLKSQKKELDEASERIKHLEGVLDAKEEIEKQQKDSIKKLNAAVEKQDKELTYTRSEMEDAKEKARSVQNALDGSYKEMAELHKKLAAKESKAQEATLSVEMNAKEEMRLALERSQQESRRDNEGLILQVNDLQMALGRVEQQAGRKEEMLRQELSDLQMRLQEAEARNQELSQTVTAATRPLLRQLENLQTNFNAQSSTWEQVERSLTERLADSQAQLASATEKERMVTETALEVGSKMASLESQLALIRQEKSRLVAVLEVEKAKVETLDESKQRELAQADSQLQTYLKALELNQREKGQLERQLEMEKMKVDSERKKLSLAQEALNDKERRLQQQQQQLDDNSSSISPISRSSTPTMHSSIHSNHSTPGTPLIMPSQNDILERTMSWSTGGTSVYESIAVGSASSVMENLQAQLKQKEGDILQRQGEIMQLERTRASMAEEIVNLSNKCDSLEELAKEIPELRKTATEIEHRYNAVLQMYGEKAEEVQELKLDLQDVKEMYRQQIEDLIRRS